jgi:hypothetical protein
MAGTRATRQCRLRSYHATLLGVSRATVYHALHGKRVGKRLLLIRRFNQPRQQGHERGDCLIPPSRARLSPGWRSNGVRHRSHDGARTSRRCGKAGLQGRLAGGTCHRPSQDATVEPVVVRALLVSHGTRHVSRPRAHMSCMKYEKGGDEHHKRKGKGSKKYCEKLYNRARTFQ